MGDPHRHHYVPAFYLKHWAGLDGKLREFTKFCGKVALRLKGTDSTGYQDHRCSFRELPPKVAAAIETTLLMETDFRGARLQQNLIADEQGPWTERMRSDWSRFAFGLRLRHPDVVPELLEGVMKSWGTSRRTHEDEYERLRKPHHPPTLDQYISKHDPLYLTRVQMHLFANAFDSRRLGKHIMNMYWDVMDVSSASAELLTSDWALDLGLNRGIVTLPLSPTKLFVATDTWPTMVDIMGQSREEIVRTVNRFVVSCARRHVWSRDERQRRFIENRMSTAMVAKPIFPSFGKLSG